MRPLAYTALGYLLLGLAGLLLAIPPGYASPVFPAAGFALAMSLRFGKSMAIAVWLASIAINLLMSSSHGVITPVQVLMATAIGAGAALQVYVARWLVLRTLKDQWKDLVHERDILIFLALGGPLACLISPTIGVYALLQSGAIGPAEFLYTWWNWWIGDTLGVLVFAPLTQIFIYRKHPIWQKRHSSIIALMIVTLGLVIAAFVMTSQWERDKQISIIDDFGGDLERRLNNRLVAQQEVLAALARTIEINPGIGFEQFDHFVSKTISDNNDISALSFNRFVNNESRSKYERENASLLKLPTFRITQKSPTGQFEIAGRRSGYVPVTLIAPLANNQAALGFDIQSEPIRRDAIERATRTRKLAATAPIHLVQDNQSRLGMLLLYPIFSPNADQQSRDAVYGFSVAVLKIDQFVGLATAGSRLQGLEYSIKDLGTPDNQGEIYKSYTDQARIDPSFSRKTQLTIADRTWQLTVYPTPEFMQQSRSWAAWAVGFVGLLYASLLQLLILSMSGRASIIQRKVDEQTQELLDNGGKLQLVLDDYNDLISRIPVGVYTLRTTKEGDFHFEFVSAMFCEQIGCSADDIMANAATAFAKIHPDDLAAFNAKNESCIRSISPMKWEGRIIRAGEVRWLFIDSRPSQSANGDIVWRGVQQDITQRKTDELEASKASQLLKEAVDHVATGFTIYDEEDRLVICNEAYLNIYATSRDLIVPGARFADIIRIGAERGQYQEAIGRVDEWVEERLYQHLNPNGLLIEQSLGDGRWLLVLEQKTPSGHIVGNRLDITAQKNAVVALQKSEQRFSVAFQSSPMAGSIAKVSNGQIVDINRNFTREFGWLREDVVGKTSVEMGLWTNDEERNHWLEALLRNGRLVEWETKWIHKSGAERQVSMSAEITELDGEPCVLAFFVDITEKLKAQEKLRQLFQAVEQSSNSIVITNAAAQIEYVNAAFCKATGYTVDEVIGQNPKILHSDQTPTETYQSLWNTVPNGKSWEGEFINRRKDGSEFTELAIISPIRNESGGITHYVAIKEDISEKKRLLNELNHYRQHLEQEVVERTLEIATLNTELAQRANDAEAANRAKSAFLANMSHEIRTPMNAIMGMAYLVSRTGVTPKQQEQLQRIDVASKHLLRIIDDILELSKIEANRLVLENAEFNLHEVVNNALNVVSGQINAKGLALTFDIKDLPQYVSGDATRLTEILVNYLSNALKFTAEGFIRLNAKVSEEFDDAVLIRFEVSDSGIGMSPEQQARVFTAFEQADNSITRKYGGTGLGLVICKHLAHLMGGEVGLVSEAGKGSSFWATLRFGKVQNSLPGGQAGLAPAPDAHEKIVGKLSGQRILLVEDEPINQEVAQEILKELGLQVDIANDGVEAIEKVALNDYSLVLMDMQMPRMSGVQAAREIRQMPGRESLPIVAMTANAFTEDKSECLGAGMNDFVTKPVMPEILVATIVKWIGKPVV